MRLCDKSVPGCEGLRPGTLLHLLMVEYRPTMTAEPASDTRDQVACERYGIAQGVIHPWKPIPKITTTMQPDVILKRFEQPTRCASSSRAVSSSWISAE